MTIRATFHPSSSSSAAGGKWELYDIEADGTELKNLADQESDKVKELGAAWDAWLKRTGGKSKTNKKKKNKAKS